MAVQGHALTVGTVTEVILERSLFGQLLSPVMPLTRFLAVCQESVSPVEQ